MIRWLDDLTLDNGTKIGQLQRSHPVRKEAKCSRLGSKVGFRDD